MQKPRTILSASFSDAEIQSVAGLLATLAKKEGAPKNINSLLKVLVNQAASNPESIILLP
jgi:hypothetical protein